jgi:hypothetical protein
MDDYNIPAENSTQDGIVSTHYDEICKRAYELYQARNGGPGSALQDWLRAEAEVVWKLTH